MDYEDRCKFCRFYERKNMGGPPNYGFCHFKKEPAYAEAGPCKSWEPREPRKHPTPPAINEVGTQAWFHCAPLWCVRGVADVILRLLEQEEITRSKARELLQAMVRGFPMPPAPWDKLNWND